MHLLYCTIKACSLFFFSPSISALTAHPLHLLYGELQLKCILGDAGLLYNLAAGFHSCLSATHKTCTHTHTEDAKWHWKDSVCVWQKEKHQSYATTTHNIYSFKNKMHLLPLYPLSTFLKKHRSYSEAPSVSLHPLLPLVSPSLSLSFLPNSKLN